MQSKKFKLLMGVLNHEDSEIAVRIMGVGLPLILSTLGLVISILVIFAARALKNSKPATVLRSSLMLPPVVLTVVSLVLMPVIGVSQNVTWALAAGAFGGALIGLITEYYTAMKPIRLVAEAAQTGAGTGVIRGLAVGMESVALPTLVVVIAAYIADRMLGLYGIALAAVGMLAGTAVVMTVDAYGPIADNAGGISEMSGLDPKVREITDELKTKVEDAIKIAEEAIKSEDKDKITQAMSDLMAASQPVFEAKAKDPNVETVEAEIVK